MKNARKLSKLALALVLSLCMCITTCIFALAVEEGGEEATAPTVYVDVDFGEDGSVTDAKNNSTVRHVNGGNSVIAETVVTHGGKNYRVPAFSISGLTAVTGSNYIEGILNITDYNEYLTLFKNGMTVEVFFQNTAKNPLSYPNNSVVFGNNNGSGWAIFINSTAAGGAYIGGSRFLISTGTSSNKNYITVLNTVDSEDEKKIYPVYEELTHVVCVYEYVEDTNTATASMYVNGVLAGTTSDSSRGYIFNYDSIQFRCFGIGVNVTGNASATTAGTGSTQQCTDLLAVDAKIYSGAATDTQVAAIYAAAVEALGDEITKSTNAVTAEKVTTSLNTEIDLTQYLLDSTGTVTAEVVSATADYTLENNVLTLTSIGTVTVNVSVAESETHFEASGNIRFNVLPTEPTVYTDVDFAADGTYVDAKDNYTLVHVGENSRIENTTVVHRGMQYTVPAFVISGLNSAAASDYIAATAKNFASVDDYYDLFKNGMTTEVFFRNTAPNGAEYNLNSMVFGNTNSAGWGIMLDNSQTVKGGIRTLIRTTNSAYLTVNVTNPAYKQLTHAVMAYSYNEAASQSTSTLYVNGVFAGTKSAAGSIYQNPNGNYMYYGIGNAYLYSASAGTGAPGTANQCTDLVVVDAKMYAGCADENDAAGMYSAAVAALGEGTELVTPTVNATLPAITVTKPFDGWADGENTFTVNHTLACYIAISNDGGTTFTKLEAVQSGDVYNVTATDLSTDSVISVGVLGDVNGDGVVDATDAQATFNAIRAENNALSIIVSDTNGNGRIDALDARQAYVAATKPLEW